MIKRKKEIGEETWTEGSLVGVRLREKIGEGENLAWLKQQGREKGFLHGCRGKFSLLSRRCPWRERKIGSFGPFRKNRQSLRTCGFHAPMKKFLGEKEKS